MIVCRTELVDGFGVVICQGRTFFVGSTDKGAK